jgi:hypothetical protein
MTIIYEEIKHPSYDSHIAAWEKIRDVIAGEDAVKEKGIEYLPSLGGSGEGVLKQLAETGSFITSSYPSYLLRASFYEASSRTVDGIKGVVFKKAPQIEFPKSQVKLLDNIGEEGTSLVDFAKEVFENVFSIGRHGVLLDFDSNLTDANIKPYLVGFRAEDILNWKIEKIEGENKLVMLVLRESGYEEGNSIFEHRAFQKRRVLTLNKDIETDGYVYKVTIFKLKKNSDKKDEWLQEKEENPIIRGKTISYIPFMFFGVNNNTSKIDKSPILGIVNMNLSHYRSSADIEHGRHFTALPTAWVAGFDVAGMKLEIGSPVAWVSENPNAKAGYLEYKGQGLGAIENALEHKEKQMASMGARLLEEPRKAVESADSHKQRRSGEESITASIANGLSNGFTKILEWITEWNLLTGEVSIIFNTKYVSDVMQPQMLTALMLARQQGEISRDTFLYNMQKSEILPDGRSVDDELDLIDTAPITKTDGTMDLDEEEEEEDGEKDTKKKKEKGNE